jgi:hypothetical protein
MKRFVLTVIFTVAIAMTVWGFSSGPPDGRTGAPGEGICTDCHTSFPLNSGDGSLALNGLPDFYSPGATYPCTVALEDPGQQRWGFELAAKDEDDLQAGTITATDGVNTQTSVTGGITYLKHTSTGTYSGTPDGPVSWTFDWTAPTLKGPGRVYFYVAGNGANGADGNQGDYIYSIVARTEQGPQAPSTGSLGKLVLVLLILTATALLVRQRRLFPRRV